MTDNTPAAQSRAPKAMAAIGAAVLGVLAFTDRHEGTVFRAYRDPAGIWTIGNGHTAGVKAGDVATAAQCSAYAQADTTARMEAVATATPTLVERPNALKAAGDFAFNAGDGAWARSPMAAAFAKRQWEAGCNAFVGYYSASTFQAPQPRYQCRPKKGGGYLCNLPGLVQRRLDERALCLAAHLSQTRAQARTGRTLSSGSPARSTTNDLPSGASPPSTIRGVIMNMSPLAQRARVEAARLLPWIERRAGERSTWIGMALVATNAGFPGLAAHLTGLGDVAPAIPAFVGAALVAASTSKHPPLAPADSVEPATTAGSPPIAAVSTEGESLMSIITVARHVLGIIAVAVAVAPTWNKGIANALAQAEATLVPLLGDDAKKLCEDAASTTDGGFVKLAHVVADLATIAADKGIEPTP